MLTTPSSESASLEPLVKIERPRIPDAQKLILVPLDIRFKTFDSFLTPNLRSQLRQEFAEYLGQPNYPVLVGNRLIDRVCETALSGYSPEEAHQLLGRSYVERYRETVLGWLLGLISRLKRTAGPIVSMDWVMRGLPRQYAGATNYGTYWLAELGHNHWRFDFEDDPGYPNWLLGTFQAGGEFLKLQDLSITCELVGPQHMSFQIRWGSVGD
jgi:uncharacterized protein (TIGR02265 family)